MPIVRAIVARRSAGVAPEALEVALCARIQAGSLYEMPDGRRTRSRKLAIDAWTAAVPQRGGARPGAGRKPTGKAGVPVKVRVSPAASQIASKRGGAWLDRVIVDADERERLDTRPSGAQE